MERLLASLRAAAEPTRLRLLALAARGAFCVMEFTEILGQSQPRLSRHLKLLCDCGLLDRVREGANVWFALPHGRGRAPWPATWSPACRPTTRSWKPTAARPPGCWPNAPASPRKASASKGADWDEMRALGPAGAGGRGRAAVAGARRGRRRPAAGHRHRHRPGAGTAGAAGPPGARRRRVQGHAGAGPRAAGARRTSRTARCGWPTCTGCRWRTQSFDTVVLQMVLHYAEDPAGACCRGGARAAPGRPAARRSTSAHHDRARPDSTSWRIAGRAFPMRR